MSIEPASAGSHHSAVSQSHAEGADRSGRHGTVDIGRAARRQRAGCLRRAERLVSLHAACSLRASGPLPSLPERPSPPARCPPSFPKAAPRAQRRVHTASHRCRGPVEGPPPARRMQQPRHFVPRLCRPLFGGRASPPPGTHPLDRRPAGAAPRARRSERGEPASHRPPPPPARAAAAMAQDDLPVLPSNFFNDPQQSGQWKWETDFKDVVEIGKGKVRGAGGGGLRGRHSWPSYNVWRRAAGPPPALLGAGQCVSSVLSLHSNVMIRLQDTVIYSAVCPKLGTSKRVAVKVYDKTKVQATKYRAIKREIAMMMYFMRKRCVGVGGACGRRSTGWLGVAVGASRLKAPPQARAHPHWHPTTPATPPPRRLPSVVDYYCAFHDQGHLYIVMEYCGGGDLLEKLLRDKKAMNEKKVAIEVAYPCLSILQTLHEMRIIHRWRKAVGDGHLG